MTSFSNNEYALDMSEEEGYFSDLYWNTARSFLKFDLVQYNKESVCNCLSACELIFSDKNN